MERRGFPFLWLFMVSSCLILGGHAGIERKHITTLTLKVVMINRSLLALPGIMRPYHYLPIRRQVTGDLMK